ncbi:hypothetical protein OL229_19025 [Neisseriaceae bacterium JH1-16]|nr:hypothetical protein [Neisseriaceae bacterium JH1-16]
MRKHIITLTFAVISTQALAGASDICNMKPSQYERDQCIEYGARGSMLRVKGNSDRLMQSTRVPQSEKESIAKSHKQWASKVESKCSTNECYWDMASKRNNELEQIMAKYGIAPL